MFVGAWLVGFDGMAGVVGAVGARWLRRVGFDGVAFQKGFVFEGPPNTQVPFGKPPPPDTQAFSGRRRRREGRGGQAGGQ